MTDKILTIALMDPPYESANSTTALRIIGAALKKGISVNVFAYEGAVNLAFKDHAPAANPVKETTVERRIIDGPNFVRFSARDRKANPLLTWFNCGLCLTIRRLGIGRRRETRRTGDFLTMARNPPHLVNRPVNLRRDEDP